MRSTISCWASSDIAGSSRWSMRRAPSSTAHASTCCGPAFSRLDHAFHDLWGGELGYRGVQSVADAARANLDRTRESLRRAKHRQSRSYAEHMAIADALKRRDPDAAQRAMTAHLDR